MATEEFCRLGKEFYLAAKESGQAAEESCRLAKEFGRLQLLCCRAKLLGKRAELVPYFFAQVCRDLRKMANSEELPGMKYFLVTPFILVEKLLAEEEFPGIAKKVRPKRFLPYLHIV